MKIAIIGYSGSGKSTLAQKLGEMYGLKLLHMDAVQFLSNWIERPAEEQKQIMAERMRLMREKKNNNEVVNDEGEDND